MDRANYALADYCARQNMDVHLVAYRVAPGLRAYPNVTFHQVTKPFNSYLFGSYGLHRKALAVGKAIQRRGGVMVANGGNCLMADVNWVHYVHAAYRPKASTFVRHVKRTIDHQLASRAESEALSNARLVIVNSNATRRVLSEKLRLDESKMKTIYYGMDPHTFHPVTPEEKAALRRRLGWDARPRVMFVGALGDHRKGFDVVTDAWIELCQRPQWNSVLTVVGRGAELERWKEKLLQGGCSDRAEFLGFRDDVPDLLRASDCLVSPTRYEAYGLGVHEAICCGLPAFVSATAGVAERYPDSLQELLLMDPNDSQKLVQKLEQWHSNRDEWSQRMLPFSNELRNRSWEQMSADIFACCMAIR